MPASELRRMRMSTPREQCTVNLLSALDELERFFRGIAMKVAREARKEFEAALEGDENANS